MSYWVQGFLFSNDSFLELDSGDGVKPCECIKNYRIVYFKVVDFVVCKLYLNFFKWKVRIGNFGVIDGWPKIVIHQSYKLIRILVIYVNTPSSVIKLFLIRLVIGIMAFHQH